MPSLLFLTVDERKEIFERLEAGMKKAWEKSVREENIDAYESMEELQKRLSEADLGQFPGVEAALEKAIKQLAEGKKLEDVSLDDFPADAIPSFLYSIGACGTSALLEMILQEKGLSDEDLEGAAALSRARHRILQINAVLA